MPAWATSNRMRWTLGLLLVVTLVLLFAEARRRGSHYWYDVTLDQAYRFDPQTPKVVVQAGERGFDLPGGVEPFNTAVLRLVVNSKLGGRWFAPELRVSYDGTEHSIVFEHGAEGVRYVNLPGLSPHPGRVSWTAHHLEVPAQTTELFLFANASPCDRPVMVLAPHPDDAEIAAFGVYSCAEATIVSLTAGGYATDEYAHLAGDEQSASEVLARLRAWDSVTVPRWGGVPPERAVNLGYPTTRLQEMGEQPQVALIERSAQSSHRSFNSGPLALPAPAAATWESLVDELRALIEIVRPQIVVTPHPALDSAPDHQWTTYALVEALQQVDAGAPELLLYTNHGVASEAYPYGPAASVMNLPPWFDEQVTFAGVYSHPLDKTQRRDKLLALEAMHDLRAAPHMGQGAPARTFAWKLRRAVGRVLADPFDTYSYFRRAPRPNELFVTLPADQAAGLRP